MFSYFRLIYYQSFAD